MGASAVIVQVLLNAFAEDVVLVVGLHRNRSGAGDVRVARPLLGKGHLVAVVIAVGPGLGVGPLALLGEVPLVVVGVRPGGVAAQPVARARAVPCVGAVALAV